ncbi:MAG: mechanosensitive ion channel family protein [Clostridia bacterium]|nr:mechanosensitive ion channel family protein [Clostridia bacterium]MDD4686279.1 mechanosensitive ion channel family protein [Clostridia bacterium]
MDWNKTLYDIFVIGGLRILELLAIFLAGYLVIFIMKKIIKHMLSKSKIDGLAKKFIFRSITIFLYTILVIILIQFLGVPITGLLAGLAAIGVTIGLALQDSLSSLANGIILIFTKPFKKDDSVTINGISGKIVAIQFFNTIIDTWDNRRIIIPNKNVVNYQIENTNFHSTRRFSLNYTVSLNTNIQKIRELTKNVLLSNPNIFTNPEPSFFVRNVHNDGIDIEARAWTSSDIFDTIETQMYELLFNEFKKNEIEFARKSMIMFSENRQKNLQFDSTPLPKRDLNQNPKINERQEYEFDDFLGKIILKRKRRKNKKIQEEKILKQKAKKKEPEKDKINKTNLEKEPENKKQVEDTKKKPENK